jgi:hypothetical protein
MEQAASQMVRQLIEHGTSQGYPPEYTWLVLLLAAEAVERAMVYAIGAMEDSVEVSLAAGEYAEAQARWKQLSSKSGERHEQASNASDKALKVDRIKS